MRRKRQQSTEITNKTSLSTRTFQIIFVVLFGFPFLDHKTNSIFSSSRRCILQQTQLPFIFVFFFRSHKGPSSLSQVPSSFVLFFFLILTTKEVVDLSDDVDGAFLGERTDLILQEGLESTHFLEVRVGLGLEGLDLMQERLALGLGL